MVIPLVVDSFSAREIADRRKSTFVLWFYRILSLESAGTFFNTFDIVAKKVKVTEKRKRPSRNF